MDLAWAERDSPLAQSHATRILALAEKNGIPYLWAYGHAYWGLYHVIAGNLDEGIDERAKALLHARERRAGLENEGRRLPDLAEACRLKGDLESAQRSAVEAIQIASARHTRTPECVARVVLAETLRTPSAARPELNRAVQLLEEAGARIYEPMMNAVTSKLSRTSVPFENLDYTRQHL